MIEKLMLLFYNVLLRNYVHWQLPRVNNMNKELNDKWISIEEAADYLDIKPVTLRGWIRNEKGVPAHKIGKQWKFKRSELDQWVKSGESAIE